MATINIRLPAALKSKVARLAKRSGKTPHAFMPEAILNRLAQDALDAEFRAEAARRGVVASRQSVGSNDLK